MTSRIYKDTSPEAEKRRVKTNLFHLTEDERQEYRRKAKAEYNKRRMALVNGVAKDSIVTPSKVQHDEPLSRYLADKMIRQEAGISTRAGFSIIGDGCFRARRYQHHS